METAMSENKPTVAQKAPYAIDVEAGKRYWAMLEQGQQQPWQQTLKELTGGEQMDASAVLDYFAPLQAWLTEHNAGKQCGY